MWDELASDVAAAHQRDRLVTPRPDADEWQVLGDDPTQCGHVGGRSSTAGARGRLRARGSTDDAVDWTDAVWACRSALEGKRPERGEHWQGARAGVGGAPRCADDAVARYAWR